VRVIDLDHGGERDADQQLERLVGRFDEGVDLDVVRDLVRGGGRRQCRDDGDRSE